MKDFPIAVKEFEEAEKKKIARMPCREHTKFSKSTPVSFGVAGGVRLTEAFNKWLSLRAETRDDSYLLCS